MKLLRACLLLSLLVGHLSCVWAAAGHPHSVFPLQPGDLQRLTGAPVADVVQEGA